MVALAGFLKRMPPQVAGEDIQLVMLCLLMVLSSCEFVTESTDVSIKIVGAQLPSFLPIGLGSASAEESYAKKSHCSLP